VHDRWSLVVIFILLATDSLVVRACVGQWRAERSLRSTAFGTMPSAVSFFAALAVLLPVVFVVAWLCLATAFEWRRIGRSSN